MYVAKQSVGTIKINSKRLSAGGLVAERSRREQPPAAEGYGSETGVGYGKNADAEAKQLLTKNSGFAIIIQLLGIIMPCLGFGIQEVRYGRQKIYK